MAMHRWDSGCAQGSASWRKVHHRYVYGHVGSGRAVPVDWCTLGGAERCGLAHWFPVGELPEGADAFDCVALLDVRAYCVVCAGECEGAHGRLDVFCQRLRTLTRDTRVSLRSEEEMRLSVMQMVNVLWMESLGADAERICGLFSARILALWRARPWSVPERGEVWKAALATGMGAVLKSD